MMRNYINGVLMTCDRCGKKRFIRGNIAAYGWRNLLDQTDICPECGKKLDEMYLDYIKTCQTVDNSRE